MKVVPGQPVLGLLLLGVCGSGMCKWLLSGRREVLGMLRVRFPRLHLHVYDNAVAWDSRAEYAQCGCFCCCGC